MSHTRFSDYLAHRIEGAPFPCACPACRSLAAQWEAERNRQVGAAEALPPAFWTAQEARLREKIQRPAPARPWALAMAGGAALLALVGIGLGLVPARPAAPTPDDYEARYAAVQEALERSAIGDLEACGVLLNETEEGGTAAEEAL